MMRDKWETRVAQRIVNEGLAIPEYVPFEDPPLWDAPRLIKMLGVTRSLLDLSLEPYTIFAGQVLGPLSGEEDEQLRARPALREYYSSLDRHSESDKPAVRDSDGEINLEEDSK